VVEGETCVISITVPFQDVRRGAVPAGHVDSMRPLWLARIRSLLDFGREKRAAS
jgi:hypothetical protein